MCRCTPTSSCFSRLVFFVRTPTIRRNTSPRRRPTSVRAPWFLGLKQDLGLCYTLATDDRMGTTAGSYALVGAKAAREATVVDRLRKQGAVMLGNTSMSEWYKIRSIDRLPNGWCARSGQGMNPYVKTADPCGSSSGSAISVATNLVSVSLGTDTHSSIICPSDHNGVVGFRPIVSLVRRAGVIPISPRQDTVKLHNRIFTP